MKRSSPKEVSNLDDQYSSQMLKLGKELAGDSLPKLNPLITKYPALSAEEIQSLYFIALQKKVQETPDPKEQKTQQKLVEKAGNDAEPYE